MNDPLVVRSFESFGNLFRNHERFTSGNWTTGDARRERFASYEFHHEELPLARFFQTVDCRDVRVIQRRQHPRFTSRRILSKAALEHSQIAGSTSILAI